MSAPSAAVEIVPIENMPETVSEPEKESAEPQKRPQFGTRFLTDPRQVFQHNAWDNVEWSAEQEEAALKKVQENSQPLPADKQEQFDSRANEYWNDFYTIHENRFFKDRHWLFTEFPELAPRKEPAQDVEENRTTRFSLGGNSSVLLLRSDPGLFVYGCDFSSTAVELVKSNPEYDASRCQAFVHDMSDESADYPMPDQSLDVIVLIFVLMQSSINRMARLLKPGGVLLLRDYGRYDMAQLRFKKDELHDLLSRAGLEKVQNLVDRRLQVNRGKQLTMYRVWVQCKYRKALAPS
ncbi:hypothetical protein DNTS_017851 [Danionella cerebrum]|uniref:tRNA N(3)-cytidine methyltransferase n=1 Tax=Danionella cerebrum TaxID=2873325 RepID=A0A553R0F4_9TELE|nr:hypothetical protein DNTS_017851 [Danionella translucida]